MYRRFLGGKCGWIKVILDRSYSGYKGMEERKRVVFLVSCLWCVLTEVLFF